MKKVRINNEITCQEVRLVLEDKTAIVISTAEALKRAEAENNDLVEIYPDVNPPVCKIINYEKYMYKMQKDEKEIKKRHKTSVLKEMQFSLGIGSGDYKTKLGKVVEFIGEGNKVQFSILLKKKQIMLGPDAEAMLNNIISELGDTVKVEKAPYQEKKKVFAIISPQSKKKPNKPSNNTNNNSPINQNKIADSDFSDEEEHEHSQEQSLDSVSNL